MITEAIVAGLLAGLLVVVARNWARKEPEPRKPKRLIGYDKSHAELLEEILGKDKPHK